MRTLLIRWVSSSLRLLTNMPRQGVHRETLLLQLHEGFANWYTAHLELSGNQRFVPEAVAGFILARDDASLIFSTRRLSTLWMVVAGWRSP